MSENLSVSYRKKKIVKIAYHKEYSRELGRDMEYKVYGHRGKPVLVFPTSLGKFYQYEDFGMIEVIKNFIDDGLIQVWTCDSIDGETFYAAQSHPGERIKGHEQYDRYIIRELIPSIVRKSRNGNNIEKHKLLVTGCSMGAYYSANFFFRHPEFFDTLIALSGVYATRYFFGDYMDETTYFNSPIDYLRNLSDKWYLDQYRKSKIIICSGQGAYEEKMIEDTLQMKTILDEKNIPAWVDIWGYDVNHDWCWWKKQIVYFLNNCFSI